ncbi:DUF3226 domain-containing protein [Vibrio harveyi]
MIEQEKVVLVEGNDEVEFFRAFCNKHQINDVQFIETGGKERFKDELPVILNAPGFEKVISLGIVRDADLSQQSALQSVQSQLRKHSLPEPRVHGGFANDDRLKVGIFIMPGNRDQGMLESLMLDTVDDHPVKVAAEEYINNLPTLLENTAFKPPKNIYKAKLHAYLAGMKDHKPSLGLAAQKGYFNLESPALESLKLFVTTL